MLKLRTRIMLLVCTVVAAILLLNHYPVSLSMRQTVTQASISALADVTRQLAESGELVQAMQEVAREEQKTEMQADARRRLAVLARRAERCFNCSGVAILDNRQNIIYNSPEHGINRTALQDRAALPPEAEDSRVLFEGTDRAALYAVYPIRDPAGRVLGRVVSTLQYGHNQEGMQKAQRELNAMTVLVMLIALLFVWDLTDRIKGSMFNLEPAEIAQLLVERTALIDAVRDGIFSVDEEGRVLQYNRRAAELFRQQSEEKEIRFADIVRNLSLKQLLDGGVPLFDYECRIGSGSFYMSFIPIEVENSVRKSLLITFRPKQEIVRFAEDITGVRSYVEALRTQMHEFNNKLQVVSGLVHEKNYAALEEYIDGLIHLKQREKSSISAKIRDPILSAFLLSKFDRAAEQKVDLVLTGKSKCEGPLSDELAQDLVVISGNLLENAFDAVQGNAMRMVTLEIAEMQNEIVISVWNSGDPIPEEMIEHIFEYGVTDKVHGNGIGLYLVQRACARHNGYVSVSSDIESGTEFVAHVQRTEEKRLCMEC